MGSAQQLAFLHHEIKGNGIEFPCMYADALNYQPGAAKIAASER
jgi:hypothetical protein